MTTKYRNALASERPVTPGAHGNWDGWGFHLLLAEHARNAQNPGHCTLCSHPYSRGVRIADLADGTGTAHVNCVGQSARPGAEAA